MLKFLEKIADRTPRLLKWVLIICGPISLLLRVAIPHYVENSQLLQEKITEFSGRPVVAQRIDYQWQGWSPQITISGLQLLDDKKKKVLLYFPKLTATISLVDSIAKRAIESKNIQFSGLSIEILQSVDGRFRIVGMPPPKFPIFKWLLHQNKVEISESNILLTLEKNQHSTEMRAISAISTNSSNGQVIKGRMKFLEDFATQGAFVLTSDKNIVESTAEFKINFLLESANSNDLLSRFTKQAIVPTIPLLDIEGWSTWRHSDLRELSFRFSETANAATTVIPDIRGKLNRTDAGWDINFVASRTSSGVKKHLGQVASVLILNTQRQSTLITKADNIDLAAALKLRQFFPRSSTERKELSFEDSLTGKLTSVTSIREFNDSTTNNYSAQFTFADLSSPGDENVPPFSGLSGKAKIFPNGADLMFTDSSIEIYKHRKIHTPLSFNKINGALVWRTGTSQGKAAILKRFTGNVNNINFAFNGHASRHSKADWQVDGLLDINNGPASNLHHLILANSLPVKGDYWVRNAFSEGLVEHGSLIIRGPAKKIPFRNMEGVFSANFRLTAAKIKYSKLWPPAKNVSGIMKIRGISGSFEAEKGEVKGVRISDGLVDCSDLFAREKYVQIKANASINDGIPEELINESPLKKTRASQVLNFALRNTVHLSLDMNLPLFLGGEKYITGKAYFKQNEIKNKNIDLTFMSTNGTLTYTNGRWFSTDLSAILDNSKVKLDIRGGLNSPSFDTEFVVSGQSSTTQIFRRLERHAPSFKAWLDSYKIPPNFKGSTSWQNTLRLPRQQIGQQNKKAHMMFSTDLTGVAITLPKPFAKNAIEIKPLKVNLILLNGKVESTNVTYNKLFQLESSFLTEKKPARPNEMSAAEPVLNVLPQLRRTLRVNVSAEYVPMDNWLSIIDVNKTEKEKNPQENGLILNLAAKKIAFWNYQFNSSNINVTRRESDYLLTFQGLDVDGIISLPRLHLENEIEVGLKKLKLIPLDSTSSPRGNSSISSIPSADIKIKSLMYHGIQLGEADIKIQKSVQRIDFARLNFRSVDAIILGNGSWEKNPQGEKSTLNLSLTGSKASNVMAQFGFRGNNIKGGKTEVHASLEWPNSPSQFDVQHVTGNLNLKIMDGRFKDIEPGAGRIFGLLSVQSLPRRLSLDFKDLFKKGFAFDAIEGSFALKEGNAFTDGLIMNGPSAKIEINGRTGLVTKDYDQTAIVTPALSNSIPVASALFGPVGIGAGAVYYIGQKVFKSLPERVDNFLKQEYSIKGSWAEPEIERL